MSNPLLLIRIESSPTENCLNIAFAEAEYDGKLVQLIRCRVCRDTPAMLIRGEFPQMFGIFRFHLQSDWFFLPLLSEGGDGRLLRSILHPRF